MRKGIYSEINVSIVIPVYCGEFSLPNLVSEICESMHCLGLGKKFEIILVNDASPDKSWAVIESLAARFTFLRGICLSQNVGQHNAIMAGLREAEGEIVVLMDDDLQHPPAMLGRLIDAIEEGFDVCYTQYKRRRHPLWKKLGSRFSGWVANHLLDKPMDLYLSSFKAIHRRTVNQIKRYQGAFVYIDGLILESTNNITCVPIDHQARRYGESQFGIRKSISLWLKMATGFSIAPIRVAAIMGGVLIGAAVILSILLVMRGLLGSASEIGCMWVAALIVLLSGIQLLMLGVVGEYVGRSYLSINKKPQYSIKKMIGKVPGKRWCITQSQYDKTFRER